MKSKEKKNYFKFSNLILLIILIQLLFYSPNKNKRNLIQNSYKVTLIISGNDNTVYQSIYNTFSFYRCTTIKINGRTITSASSINYLNQMNNTVMVDFGANIQYFVAIFSEFSNNVLSIHFSEFDTSSILSMNYMFKDMVLLTSLDLSNFDTSQVNDMSYMFFNCSNLIYLDLNIFELSSVNTMEYMFCYCSSLEVLNFSNFLISSTQNFK